jgi:putative transposase
MPGSYFVTVCTHGRECTLGEIVDGKCVLSDVGEMVELVWRAVPDHYSGVLADSFVVMPNHVHGIIVLTDTVVGATPCGRPDERRNQLDPGQARGPAPTIGNPRLSLSDVVHRIKSLTTTRYRERVHNGEWSSFRGRFWQRGFHDHIIRNEHELHAYREYIKNNPMKWDMDYENPVNTGDGATI